MSQVNTGEEPQKAGVAPAEADAFIAACRMRLWPDHRGPDVHPAAGRAGRPAFRPAGQDRRAATAWRKLSMGMSADFETAIRFGATSVRVGSALFGPRPGHD